jgi:hypothetical protein
MACAAAAKVSVAAAPAVGCVYAPAGYVVKADVLPVMLIDGPAQPAPKVHADAHAGQLPASPNVVGEAPPVAAHAATVMSVHELAPASELEPDGQGVAALEPSGQ